MRRVAITGLSVVSPLGLDLKVFWHLLIAGHSGIKPLTQCHTDGLSSTLAGEVTDFDPTDFIPKKQARRMSRASQFAVASALMAVYDARLQFEMEDRGQIAVCMGTSIAGLREALDAHAEYIRKNCQHFNPFTMTSVFPNAVSGEVAISLGIHGVSETYSNGCSSTANALGRAYDLIQLGHAEVVIAGGTEAPLHHGILSAMDAGRMLANDSGGTVRNIPRPFDRTRCGIVLGEGAGCLVLEDYEHAIRRGARIYAELDGWSFTCDAHSMAKPESTGIEHTRAIRKTLSAAGWFPEEVDYINACGLGTAEMDLIETVAIKQALSAHAYNIPVSSLKGQLGHAFAASGAFQAVATALAIQHQVVPPTVNWVDPDPECDLDYVGSVGKAACVNHALVNSFGFGGKNVVVAMSRPNRSILATDSEWRTEKDVLGGALTGTHH